MFDHTLLICLSSLSPQAHPPYILLRPLSFSFFLFLYLSPLSLSASILSDLSVFIHFRAPWLCSCWYVQEMSRRRFLRRFIPFEVAPCARSSLSLSSSFRLYFYKNSRIHVRNKNAMDFEKTYERETILPVLISNLQQIFGNLLF